MKRLLLGLVVALALVCSSSALAAPVSATVQHEITALFPGAPIPTWIPLGYTYVLWNALPPPRTGVENGATVYGAFEMVFADDGAVITWNTSYTPIVNNYGVHKVIIGQTVWYGKGNFGSTASTSKVTAWEADPAQQADLMKMVASAPSMHAGTRELQSVNTYPTNLNTAVAQAYAKYDSLADYGQLVQTCDVFSGAPARDSALVISINPSDGSRDLSAYMFINTAGWNVVYIDHKPVNLGGGYTSQMALSLVATLKRSCSNWSATTMKKSGSTLAAPYRTEAAAESYLKNLTTWGGVALAAGVSAAVCQGVGPSRTDSAGESVYLSFSCDLFAGDTNNNTHHFKIIATSTPSGSWSLKAA